MDRSAITFRQDLRVFILTLKSCVELCAPEVLKVVENRAPAVMEAYLAGAKYYTFK